VTKRLLHGCYRTVFAIGTTIVALRAQNNPSVSTCKTAPPAAQSFSIERTMMPLDTHTTFATSLPVDILASLAAGTKEIREQLLYKPQANALTSTVFLVPAGTPIPTPATTNISPMTLASYTISVNRTFTSCSPVPTLMFTGTVTASTGGALAANGIYNLSFSGTPASVSVGYTTDNPPQINNVVTLLAGVAVSYSAAGAGSVTFVAGAPPGQPGITSVVNAASLLPNIAPYSLATIMGSNFTSTTDTWSNAISNGTLPSSLDGVSVMVGGTPAYISYISPTQINFIVPQTSSTGNASVTVKNSSGTTAAFTVASSQDAPAIFAWPGNQAVALHQDLTDAVKAGTFAGLATTPAKPGETIILYGTGFGPTTPAAPTGMVIPASPTYATTLLPSVTLNNQPVTVLGATLVAGSAALYQVTIQIPSSIGTGDLQLQVSVGGTTSPLGLILSVVQ